LVKVEVKFKCKHKSRILRIFWKYVVATKMGNFKNNPEKAQKSQKFVENF
jgi:hypothetical protein